MILSVPDGPNGPSKFFTFKDFRISLSLGCGMMSRFWLIYGASKLVKKTDFSVHYKTFLLTIFGKFYIMV